MQKGKEKKIAIARERRKRRIRLRGRPEKGSVRKMKRAASSFYNTR